MLIKTFFYITNKVWRKNSNREERMFLHKSFKTFYTTGSTLIRQQFIAFYVFYFWKLVTYLQTCICHKIRHRLNFLLLTSILDYWLDFESASEWQCDCFNKAFLTCFGEIEARGGSRTAAASKMKLFVIVVKGFQSLTITTKRSILDLANVLDPPLEMDVILELDKSWLME